MKTITEETFCHDFDEIMDNVIEGKQYYIVTTRDGSKVLVAPFDPSYNIDLSTIQLREEGN